MKGSSSSSRWLVSPYSIKRTTTIVVATWDDDDDDDSLKDLSFSLCVCGITS